jgi:hypothetical protein
LGRDVLTFVLHLTNGDSAGNYHLMDEESTEEWDSAGNYQLIDEESTRGRDSAGNYQRIYADSDR